VKDSIGGSWRAHFVNDGVNRDGERVHRNKERDFNLLIMISGHSGACEQRRVDMIAVVRMKKWCL